MASYTVQMVLFIALIVVGAMVIAVILRRTVEKYDFTGDPCVDHCRIAHPEAARMYMDEANDVADNVMEGCIQRCRNRGGVANPVCETCG